MRTLRGLILLLLLFSAAGCNQTTAPVEGHRTVSEKLVAQIDSSVLVRGSFASSPDHRRVAYVAEVGAKQFVVVDR